MPSSVRKSCRAILLGLRRPALIRISSSSPPDYSHTGAEALSSVKPPACTACIDQHINKSSTACAVHLHRPLQSSETSRCFSSDAAINRSLHMFLQQIPLLPDIQDRIRILDTTCTACSALNLDPILDDHAAAACVEVILNLLNDSTHKSLHHLTAPMVMQTEKALMLLDLLTMESEASRTAALHRLSSVTHALGRTLLRLSEACTASAMAILITLCSKYSVGTTSFRHAIAMTAIPCKLVVVLQVASKDSTRQSAGKLLQLIHT